MAAVTICSDFGALKNKLCHCIHCFPIYLPWSKENISNGNQNEKIISQKSGSIGKAAKFYELWSWYFNNMWEAIVCINYIPWSKENIKKQRHYFASKGLSSQSYDFSSSHEWMWDLDYEESWAPKNRCFWTVVLEKTLGLQGNQTNQS